MAYYKSIPDAEEHIKDLETKPYEVCSLLSLVLWKCSIAPLDVWDSRISFAYMLSVLTLPLAVFLSHLFSKHSVILTSRAFFHWSISESQ